LLGVFDFGRNGGKMEDFENLVKIQQQYEFLKKHPETKVYPFQKSDTEMTETKFYFYHIKRKWKRIRCIICIMVAVLLSACLTFFELAMMMS